MKINSTPDAVERYRKKIMSFAPLSNDDFEHVADIMHEKHFRRGEVILKEGQVCKEYYFILNGCIRSFGMEDGEEVNVAFYFEDDIACDFASFRSGEPSQFYLIAVEDTTVYFTTRMKAIPVFERTHSLHMFLFRFFQELYLREKEHSNTFKLLSPEDRYHYLREHKPHYLQRIPVAHLASYLGMSRKTLFRIRKKDRPT